MQKKISITVALIVLVFAITTWRQQGQTAQDSGALTAIKADKAPTLDGKIDDLWKKAKDIKINVSGGANLPKGATEVSLKAVYTPSDVYFLAQWRDPTQSNQRSPWKKQADGWVKLVDPDDKGGDNNKYYEDKFAMLWNINIAGFETAGCMVSCHAGEAGKPYGNKYTANPGEIGDLWHWKGVRTGPVGQIDDQYLDSTKYDKDKSPEAGRKSDAKTGAGGYVDNVSDDKKGPKFAAKGNKPAPPYWIFDKEKEPLDGSKYKEGQEVASIIIAPFAGDRGDISARSNWSNGVWTLEFSRKLKTGGQSDVQFDDLNKQYAFGVAVFDNAQVRHAFATQPSKLVFQK